MEYYSVYNDDRRYKTSQWEGLRLAVLRRDKKTCQECKRKGLRKTAEMVHHIEPYIDELFYETTNLISFCLSCHNKMHIRGTQELTVEGKKWVRRRRLGLVKGIKLI